MGWLNESSFKGTRSSDQDGHHTPMKIFFPQNRKVDALETWYAAMQMLEL